MNGDERRDKTSKHKEHKGTRRRGTGLGYNPIWKVRENMVEGNSLSAILGAYFYASIIAALFITLPMYRLCLNTELVRDINEKRKTHKEAPSHDERKPDLLLAQWQVATLSVRAGCKATLGPHFRNGRIMSAQ
jgi:hypothetical protein